MAALSADPPWSWRRFAVTASTAAMLTMYVWTSQSEDSTTKSVLALVLIPAFFVAMIWSSRRQTRRAATAGASLQPRSAIPAFTRRRLTFLRICLGMLLVSFVIAASLAGTAEGRVEVLLFGVVVVALGAVTIAVIGRRARFEPHLFERPPRWGQRRIAVYALIIPIMLASGGVYTLLESTLLIALLATFVVSFAGAWLLGSVERWIIGKDGDPPRSRPSRRGGGGSPARR